MVSTRMENGKIKYGIEIQDFLLFISIILGNVGLVMAYQGNPLTGQFLGMGLVLFQIHYIIRLLAKMRYLKKVKE